MKVLKSPFYFRNNLSINDALLEMILFIYENLDEGQYVLIIFLKMKKTLSLVEYDIH